MKTRIAPLIGSIIGVLPVSVLYFDGYWDLQLATIIWATFAIAGWLGVRRRDVWRSRGSWWSTRDNRWSALLVVVILGGAQFGVHMDLPISDDLTVALSVSRLRRRTRKRCNRRRNGHRNREKHR